MVERDYERLEIHTVATMHVVAWASGLVEVAHVKHHELNTRIEECMECLRYWVRLVWEYPTSGLSNTPIGDHHRGSYRGGDPDDVQEARDEIKRDNQAQHDEDMWPYKEDLGE